MVQHRYDQWIDYLFDHPVSKPEWHLDLDSPYFDATDTELAGLIEQTFTHAGKDLARFSNAQVNQGLYYLAFPAFSEYLDALKSPEVPIAQRLSAIRSIFFLYRDCFQARCSPVLGHLDQLGRPLNGTCYMFWDITSLLDLERRDAEEEMVDAVFSVLADTLELPHLGCKEAAIHGYGEIFHSYPDRAREAMEEYLATEIENPALQAYAESARFGCIL